MLEKSVDVNHFVCWKDGYLSYEETPIAEVLSQIERYYNLLLQSRRLHPCREELQR